MPSRQPTSKRPRNLISAERRQRVIPLSFQLTGMALNLISMLHNEWAADVLARFWFTVFKSTPKPWVAEFWKASHRCINLKVDDVKIPVHCWGEGPLVVMMHGWSGTGTQFRYFIGPLVDSGFTAICFDAPEHGSNPGRETHMLRFSSSLAAIERALGTIDCIIGHSLGAMAATYAIQCGLKPKRAVLIAPHLEVQKMFESYRDLLKMRPALAQRFYDKIGMRMRDLMQDRDPWSTLVPAALLDTGDITGMLVYDHDDAEISVAQFQQMIDCWPGCVVHDTHGLGHNQILKDAAVIAYIMSYLKS